MKVKKGRFGEGKGEIWRGQRVDLERERKTAFSLQNNIGWVVNGQDFDDGVVIVASTDEANVPINGPGARNALVLAQGLEAGERIRC
jgi:hypothetical protein